MPRLQKVMADGTFVLGNEVREFEENLVKYCGCKYAVGVANGTDAIILALKALGIQSEDEVITAANTFVQQRKPLNMRARSRSWRIVTRSPEANRVRLVEDVRHFKWTRTVCFQGDNI